MYFIKSTAYLFNSNILYLHASYVDRRSAARIPACTTAALRSVSCVQRGEQRGEGMLEVSGDSVSSYDVMEKS
jgi:hypothetical protein